MEWQWFAFGYLCGVGTCLGTWFALLRFAPNSQDK